MDAHILSDHGHILLLVCARANMDRTNRRVRWNMKLLLLLVFAVAAVAQKSDAKKSNVKLPEGPGKALTERVCTSCHGLENVVRARMTKERWNSVVEDMVSR